MMNIHAELLSVREMRQLMRRRHSSCPAYSCTAHAYASCASSARREEVGLKDAVVVMQSERVSETPQC